MKASSASSNLDEVATTLAAMHASRGQPFSNLRFRVVVEGLPETGATEVVFPQARIVRPPRKRRVVQFDALVIRRGLTLSTEWYKWWDHARRAARPTRREVRVILLDRDGVDAVRWAFARAVPVGYSLSPLNALAGETVIESLELQVGGFEQA